MALCWLSELCVNAVFFATTQSLPLPFQSTEVGAATLQLCRTPRQSLSPRAYPFFASHTAPSRAPSDAHVCLTSNKGVSESARPDSDAAACAAEGTYRRDPECAARRQVARLATPSPSAVAAAARLPSIVMSPPVERGRCVCTRVQSPLLLRSIGMAIG